MSKNLRNIIREEIKDIQWIKDTNPLKEGYYYIDADGLSREERLDLQQKILDLGFRWDERYNIPHYTSDNLNHIALNTLRGYVLNGVDNRITYTVLAYPQYAKNWLTYLSYNNFIKLYNQNINENDGKEWIKDDFDWAENPIEVGNCFTLKFITHGNPIFVIDRIEEDGSDLDLFEERVVVYFKMINSFTSLGGTQQVNNYMDYTGPARIEPFEASFKRVGELIDRGILIPVDCGNNLNESSELEWIKDVKIRLGDAWKAGLINDGDILTLSGELADSDDLRRIMVTDFRIKIIEVKNKFTDSYFVPLDEKYYEYIGYDNEEVRFYITDKKLEIVDHIKVHDNLNIYE